MENVDEARACRNKLAVEIDGDIEKMLRDWDLRGWHRVTFYGNLAASFAEMADVLGLKIVQEA